MGKVVPPCKVRCERKRTSRVLYLPAGTMMSTMLTMPTMMTTMTIMMKISMTALR